MTYEQVLNKLTAYCAKGEHCIQEARQKMERWQIEPSVQQRVIEYLQKERYIDEARYARFFINDKMRYNRWGKRKIEQALYMKRIPREVYSPLLEEIEDDSYMESLVPLLRAKRASVKGGSDYEIRGKLIRYAMQRGFSYEQAEKAIAAIEDA